METGNMAATESFWKPRTHYFLALKRNTINSNRRPTSTHVKFSLTECSCKESNQCDAVNRVLKVFSRMA